MVAAGSWGGKHDPSLLYIKLMCESAKSFAVLVEDLARRTGAAVVFPDYTLAPHRTFPFPFEQSYEVLEYMIRHGKEYNLLVKTIALAGDSVGGMFCI
jgi:acetyl esterase/lipase